jgi:hypothetical protein
VIYAFSCYDNARVTRQWKKERSFDTIALNRGSLGYIRMSVGKYFHAFGGGCITILRIALPDPTMSAKAKRGRKTVGMSAAAAKQPRKNRKPPLGDPRSLYLTNEIVPRIVSGGAPGSGKRK